jgi:hypothetical protein
LFVVVAVGEIYLAPSHGWYIGGGALILVALSFTEHHRHITDCALDLARWFSGQTARICMVTIFLSKKVTQACSIGVRRSINICRSIDALRNEGVIPRLRAMLRQRIRRWLKKI